jgi:glucose-1-phosphate cytidylyltransferase
LTYGDGLSDVNITDLIAFHKSQNVLATVTAASPPGRFGALHIEGDKVTSFQEKPDGDGSRINAGFFILKPSVLDYISDDNTVWEREPLEALAAEGNLSAFKHNGFWHPMDTLRDKMHLEELWKSGEAPWKVW